MFQEEFQVAKAFRVVNGHDIVAGVPPENAYRHVGELKFIDPKGGIHGQSDPADEYDDAPCHEDSNTSGSAKEEQKSASALFIPSSIRDHVPLLYSILLWNELVESLKSDADR